MDAYWHVWDEYCDQYQSDWEAEGDHNPWAGIEVAYRYGWEAAANTFGPQDRFADHRPTLIADWPRFCARYAPADQPPPSWDPLESIIHAGWQRARSQFAPT